MPRKLPEILIVARHGEYDKVTLQLNEAGMEDIEELGKLLDRYLHGQIADGKKIAILTSTAPRAVAGAKILGSVFGVESEPHEILWFEDGRPFSMEDVLKLVDDAAERVHIVVLMTHYEYCMLFPQYFGTHRLNISLSSDQVIHKSEAVIVDCERKTLRVV